MSEFPFLKTIAVFHTDFPPRNVEPSQHPVFYPTILAPTKDEFMEIQRRFRPETHRARFAARVFILLFDFGAAFSAFEVDDRCRPGAPRQSTDWNSNAHKARSSGRLMESSPDGGSPSAVPVAPE